MSNQPKRVKRFSRHSIRYSVRMKSVPDIIWINDLPTIEEFNNNRAYYKKLISKAVDKLFKEKSGKAVPNEALTKWLSEPSRSKRIRMEVMI